MTFEEEVQKAKEKKGISTKIVAVTLTSFILVLLVLAGPASAFRINLTGFGVNEVYKGEKVSTTASIKIQDNERINPGPISILVDADERCTFDPITGQTNESCHGLEVEVLNSGNESNGWGYQYGEPFGYGYGYGFSDIELVYNITMDTQVYSVGEHKIQLETWLSGEYYSSDIIKITLLPKGLENGNNNAGGNGGGSGGGNGNHENIIISNPINNTASNSTNTANVNTPETSNSKPENKTQEKPVITTEKPINAKKSGITGAVTGAAGSTSFWIIIVFIAGVIALFFVLRRAHKNRKFSKHARHYSFYP